MQSFPVRNATLWGTCCYFLVTKDYFGRDLLVPAVCTLGGVMFSLYAAQLLITRRDGYPFALAIKIIGPIGSICMNLWKTQWAQPQAPHYHYGPGKLTEYGGFQKSEICEARRHGIHHTYRKCYDDYTS